MVPQLNKPKEGNDSTGEELENKKESEKLEQEKEIEEPELGKEEPAPQSIDEVTSMVSSIVIASESHGIMLDFSGPLDPTLEQERSRREEQELLLSLPSSCSSEDTGRTEASLLTRVRERTASMKRSLTPTLR